MRPIRALATALALPTLVLSAGCATARNPSPTDRLLGCYYFERDATAETLRLPWGVRLTGEPLEGWPAIQQLEGVRRAATLHPQGDRDHPFGYWRPVDEDSLEVGYPAGGGLVLELGVEPDLAYLNGAAIPVGDARRADDPPGTTSGPAAVRLMRARCPEE